MSKGNNKRAREWERDGDVAALTAYLSGGGGGDAVSAGTGDGDNKDEFHVEDIAWRTETWRVVAKCALPERVALLNWGAEEIGKYMDWVVGQGADVDDGVDGVAAAEVLLQVLIAHPDNAIKGLAFALKALSSMQLPGAIGKDVAVPFELTWAQVCFLARLTRQGAKDIAPGYDKTTVPVYALLFAAFMSREFTAKQLTDALDVKGALTQRLAILDERFALVLHCMAEGAFILASQTWLGDTGEPWASTVLDPGAKLSKQQVLRHLLVDL